MLLNINTKQIYNPNALYKQKYSCNQSSKYLRKNKKIIAFKCVNRQLDF